MWLIVIDSRVPTLKKPTLRHKIFVSRFRFCLIISYSFSPQKSESVHDKWRNAEAVTPSFPGFCGELPSSKYMEE